MLSLSRSSSSKAVVLRTSLSVFHFQRRRPFANAPDDLKWKEFFSNPELYWDNRKNKRLKQYPDFKHIDKGTPLWIDSAPAWVKQKLNMLADPPSRPGQASYESDGPAKLNKLLRRMKDVAASKDLHLGRLLEEEAFATGDCNNYVLTALITMYAKCGSIVDALRCFKRKSNPNVACWNTLMLGYAMNKEEAVALKLFEGLQKAGLTPDKRSFVAAIVACTKIAEKGKLGPHIRIHELAKSLGVDSDLSVANSLLDMYAKSGDMERSQAVFNGMEAHDTESWNSLLFGYIAKEQFAVALEKFETMLVLEGSCCSMNAWTFTAAIQACSGLLALERGEEIHRMIPAFLVQSNLPLATILVDFYGRCGDLPAAEQVFACVPESAKDTAVWNTLLPARSTDPKP